MTASPDDGQPGAGPRVVIIDADRRVQGSLGDLLGVSGEVTVEGCAGDVRAALELVERVRPDAVVVDPRLPDIDAGSALLTAIDRSWPETRIVVMGWYDDPERRSLAEHADAFVAKSSSAEVLVEAIVGACAC